ncbi:ROK family transcriptional regulator [Streptomyces armeniacus]|uniref:ROK family transcriptional regulator n=1 Tax=Streptomyces armeniacus TaxID=83291 RepID=A0A345XTA5_9ACTN|nr:ROK family transcriptional regulator [Streptomyces armeniacus]AXK34871.1 ROK family transcriptional regulator [Streptomyces armeniacus]
MAWTPLAGAARSVALEVLLDGPLPRSEIARRLQLSPGSLTRLTKPLLESGLLVEMSGEHDPVTGRPTRPLDLRQGTHHFLGVKLTADAAYGVVTSMRAEVLAEDRRPLPDTEPATVIVAVAELAAALQQDVPAATAAGVSLGGQVRDHTVVSSARYLGWNDVDLGTPLAEALGCRVVVDNDLLSLTRAEQWFGAARTCDHFALLTIGEGIGYGLVTHGRVQTGPDAEVGLLGHHPLNPLGPLCPEGHQGCAEAMLTIAAIRHRTSLGLGRDVSYDACLELAEQGNPVARRVVTEAAAALGRLAAAVGNITMAEKIILSGDGIRLAQVARTALDDAIRQDRNPYARPLDITVQRTGFTEWARGAAATAIQSFVLDA